MQKKKNEEGITLIALAITIVVLLILAGVSITSGNTSIDSANDDNNKASLNLVQQAISTQYQQTILLSQTEITPDSSFSNRPDGFIGTLITSTSEIDAEGISWVMADSYMYFEDYYYRLEKEDLRQLGLTNSDFVFVVNYKTGEVYNETLKETSTGEKLYIKALDSIPTEKTVDTTFSDDE